uniref:Uncharacterized protein n=1 Tax=Theileria annulata TaxID=5874 RepID=A0A3B0N1S4_THEAN
MSTDVDKPSENSLKLNTKDVSIEDSSTIFEKLDKLFTTFKNKKYYRKYKPKSQLIRIPKFYYKFKNCYKSIDFNDIPYSPSTSRFEYNFLDIFFNLVRKGFGISQIVGSSGSGKTSICLRIAENFPGIALYLDTGGSIDPITSPYTHKFIPLRLYTCEELLLFLNHFESSLSEDKELSERLKIKARSVEMLIVDSLWIIDQLDKFQQQIFLYNLSSVLKRISFNYDICIIVCINSTVKSNTLKPIVKSELKGLIKETVSSSQTTKQPRNIYVKWNCNCNAQFLLSYKTLNFRPSNLSIEDIEYPLKLNEIYTYHPSDELPWRPPEVDQFRNFLISSKTRSSRDSSTGYINLCIIRGQTGSGKMTTIRKLCNDLRIRLIEYDPFNVVPNTQVEFDYTIDSVIRFLQSSLSRRCLRTTAPEKITTNEKILVGSRKIKRIKSEVGKYDSGASGLAGTINSGGPEEGQLVLISDLPRGILNCKYSNLYPLQSLLREVVISDTMYPLVIVTSNSNEDYLILRRIMPPNYLKKSRCLLINIKEVTRAKMTSLLNVTKKNKLLNYLMDSSGGDIRYVINNMRFYQCDPNLDIDFECDSKEETIKDYILERNNLNNFDLLGKILYNKRIPAVLKVKNDNPEEELTGDFKFLECFSLSRPINIQSSQSSETINMTSTPVKRKECSPRNSQSAVSRINSSRERQNPDSIPVIVKMFGLLSEFDFTRPMSYTRWPVLTPEPDVIRFRQTSDKMIPKLTRPVLYYSPEKMVDSIKSDSNYFANSIFDNYSDLYGHIDDCAAMLKHFVIADVYQSNPKNINDSDVSRIFLAICIRAAADSNIYGFESHKQKFHTFITHKSKSEYIRAMFQDLRSESIGGDGTKLYSKDVLFTEIIPALSVATVSQNESSEDVTQTLSIDEDYNINDVMDKVEKILEGRQETVHKLKTLDQETIFTPKFNEILQEITNHYYSWDKHSQESI